MRICVCGDEGTGKSSLIASLVKDVFIPHKLQPVLPPVTMPPTPTDPTDTPITTTIVDTSARPQDRTTLRREIRKCNVILLVYADHYSYERVALFWMPYFRSLGVNVPVVLCANKSDLQSKDGQPRAGGEGVPRASGGWGNGAAGNKELLEEEMLPVMQEFREIDACIRSSAKEQRNINEVFHLCQKAITFPIAPLYDYKEGKLKPACVAALKRIFYLCDADHDGYLNNSEMFRFQEKCFGKPLPQDDLDGLKMVISKAITSMDVEKGIDLPGFLHLNKTYADRGRHETIWIILRKYRYTDSLNLEDKFLHPRFDVPDFASAELSPAGYKFLFDLFLLFDKDSDGGLNDSELSALFTPTPGLPTLWIESSFPLSTVRNEANHVTLQGWLAQWSMTTFLEPKTTLEYLAYLGFGDPAGRDPTIPALQVTKPRKRRRRPGKVNRNVVHCYIVGASGSGKSSLLDSFLNRPFSRLHTPTLHPRRAVNSVELPGGKQYYMILEELGHSERAVLENQARLDACDLVCYAYDSSDPESFSHIVDLRTRYPQLDDLPAVYTALKADKDKTMQHGELQPDVYTASQDMAAPLHVSVNWDSISELFVALAEAATNPSLGFPRIEEPPTDRTSLYVTLGAVACAAVAAVIIWKRSVVAAN